MKTLSRATLLALLTLALTALSLGPAQAAESQAGTYRPLTPARVLDTRSGTGAPKAALVGGASITVQVSGRGGVPSSNVSAVVLNLTAVSPTAISYLTVYPAGKARPGVSSINLVAGQTRANTLTVPLGTGGKVVVFNSAGSTQVLLDVVGYYATAGASGTGDDLFPVDPERVLDTRAAGDTPFAAGERRDLVIPFEGDQKNIKALAVNVTAVSPGAAGFLTLWSGASARPGTSNLNYNAGQLVANTAIVQTVACGTDCDASEVDSPSFAIYSSQPTNVLLDLVGVYVTSSSDDGLRFRPVTPTRIVDSRSGVGGATTFGPKSTEDLLPGSPANENTVALAANVAVVKPTASTYLTIWSQGTRPGTSNLNVPAGQSLANGALIPLTRPDTFFYSVYNDAGNADVLIDVSGAFDDPLATAKATAGGQRASTKIDRYVPQSSAVRVGR